MIRDAASRITKCGGSLLIQRDPGRAGSHQNTRASRRCMLSRFMHLPFSSALPFLLLMHYMNVRWGPQKHPNTKPSHPSSSKVARGFSLQVSWSCMGCEWLACMSPYSSYGSNSRNQETIQHVQPLMPSLSYASCSSQSKPPAYLQGVGNHCHDPHCSRRQFRFAEHSAGFLNRHGMSCNPVCSSRRQKRNCP